MQLSRLPHDLTFAKLGNDLALSAKLYQQNRYKSLEYKGSLIKPEKKKHFLNSEKLHFSIAREEPAESIVLIVSSLYLTHNQG